MKRAHQLISAMAPFRIKMKTLTFSNDFYAYTVEAIRALKSRNETLKQEKDTEINELKNELKILKEEINKIKQGHYEN